MGKVFAFQASSCFLVGSGPTRILHASVKQKLEKGVWLLETDKGCFPVSSKLPFIPGQMLRLEFVQRTKGQLVYKLVSPFQNSYTKEAAFSHLFSAFMKRGLAVLEEKLRKVHLTLEHWGALDSQTAKDWAVNKECKALDNEMIEKHLWPWVLWEKEVEKGNTPSFPSVDEELWDLWNTACDRAYGQWITIPFQFLYQEQEHSALLHALIDPILQRPKFWSLKTAALNLPLCVHFQSDSGNHLRIKLIFFRQKDYISFSKCIMFLKHDLPSYVDLTISEFQQESKIIMDHVDEHI